MLVYDITQEQSFANVSKWLRNIEEVLDFCLDTIVGDCNMFRMQ